MTGPWIDAQREAYAYRSQQRSGGVEDPDGMSGGKLVTMVGRAVQDMWMAHNRVCRASTNPEYQLRARDVEPNRPRPTEAAGRRQARDEQKKRTAAAKRARAAAERAKLPEEVAKRLARDKAKADKAVAAKVQLLQADVARAAALVVAAKEAEVAAQRLVEESECAERQAIVAVATGADVDRHERVLLGAAVRMKRAEAAEASQLFARARAQVRKLERLADAARRAVTEALSSAGDNVPSDPAVSSVGPAAVSSV